MKTNQRIAIAIAIVVIVSLSTIAVIGSSAYAGSESALSVTALSIILLGAVVINLTALFYIVSNVPAWHIAHKLTPQPTVEPPPKVFTAPIVAKVKSHPLPPLWR